VPEHASFNYLSTLRPVLGDAATGAASDTHQEATVKAASTAHRYRFPPVDMLHARRYWRDRVDRAIATRLLFTDALLRAQRENLALTRYRLTLRAASLRGADTRELGRVARQVAEFRRAHGRLLKRAKQLPARRPLHCQFTASDWHVVAEMKRGRARHFDVEELVSLGLYSFDSSISRTWNHHPQTS